MKNVSPHSEDQTMLFGSVKEAETTNDVSKLEWFAKHSLDKKILGAVAVNPVTPLHALRTMMTAIQDNLNFSTRAKMTYIARRLAENKLLMEYDLAELAKHFVLDSAFVNRVFNHPNFSQRLYMKMIDALLPSYGHAATEQLFLENEFVTVEILDRFHENGELFNQVVLGRHRLYDADILDSMISNNFKEKKWHESYFYAGVAGNKNLPVKHLKLFVNSDNWLLRFGAIINPHLDDEQLDVLKEDEHEWVKYYANFVSLQKEHPGLPFEWMLAANPTSHPIHSFGNAYTGTRKEDQKEEFYRNLAFNEMVNQKAALKEWYTG